MHQVKFFKGGELKMSEMEAEINKWLASEPIRVIQIFGNIAPQGPKTDLEAINTAYSAYAPSDIFIAVLYERN